MQLRTSRHQPFSCSSSPCSFCLSSPNEDLEPALCDQFADAGFIDHKLRNNLIEFLQFCGGIVRDGHQKYHLYLCFAPLHGLVQNGKADEGIFADCLPRMRHCHQPTKRSGGQRFPLFSRAVKNHPAAFFAAHEPAHLFQYLLPCFAVEMWQKQLRAENILPQSPFCPASRAFSSGSVLFRWGRTGSVGWAPEHKWGIGTVENT